MPLSLALVFVGLVLVMIVIGILVVILTGQDRRRSGPGNRF